MLPWDILYSPGIRSLSSAYWSLRLNNCPARVTEPRFEWQDYFLLMVCFSLLMSIKSDLCPYQLLLASCPHNLLQSSDWRPPESVEFNWLYYSQPGSCLWWQSETFHRIICINVYTFDAWHQDLELSWPNLQSPPSSGRSSDDPLILESWWHSQFWL